MTDKTITVYQAEEFKLLPKETQKMIKDLSEELNVKQLNTFNPLVEAMATIEGFKDIKYVPDNDECIEQYKEAKKFKGSFNTSVKDTHSSLKKPILETGRKLDKIKNTFMNRNKEIWESVEEEFQPYLEEKEKKKKEAEDRRNKAAIDKINELSEQTVEQTIVIERSKLFKKYSEDNQKMLDDILEKVDNYSASALENELEILSKKSLEFEPEDLNILLKDQINDLLESFEGLKKTCVRMISMRLKELEEDTDRPSMPDPPAIEFNAPSLQEPISYSKAFIQIMDNAVEQIKLLPTTNDKEEQAQASSVAGLQAYTLKILNFLDDGENG